MHQDVAMFPQVILGLFQVVNLAVRLKYIFVSQHVVIIGQNRLFLLFFVYLRALSGRLARSGLALAAVAGVGLLMTFASFVSFDGWCFLFPHLLFPSQPCILCNGGLRNAHVGAKSSPFRDCLMSALLIMVRSSLTLQMLSIFHFLRSVISLTRFAIISRLA